MCVCLRAHDCAAPRRFRDCLSRNHREVLPVWQHYAHRLTSAWVSKAAREKLKSLLRRYVHGDVGGALVMTHTGFQATVVRAIVVGLSLLVDNNIKVFGAVEDGLRWLEEVTRREGVEGFNAEAVMKVLNRLRG